MGSKIFAAVVTLGFLYIASPLIFPLAMGGVLAVLFLPLLERLEKRRMSTSLASAILTLAITLCILLPATGGVFFLAKSGFQQLQSLKTSPPGGGGGDLVSAILGNPKVQVFLDKVSEFFPIGKDELFSSAQDLVRSIGTKLADLLGGLLTQLPGMVMALAVIVVSIYFFLVDGRKLILFVRRNSVFNPDQTEQVLHSLAIMCRSVILASLISGGAQAVLEIAACLVTGTPNPELIGIMVFMGSFVPLVGAAPVTLGVATQQLLLGRSGVAIALYVMAVAVSMIDNLIRPLFLRGSANLHPLLAFVAAFGGLQTLGFLGIFLGPIIAAAFVMTIQIVATKPVGAKAAG